MPDGKTLFVKSGRGETARLIADESVRLIWLHGKVPAINIVHVARCDDAIWLVSSAVAGVTAGALLSRDRAHLPQVVAGLASFLKALHALPAKNCPFDSSIAAWLPVARQRVDARLVDEDNFDRRHAGWSARRVLTEVEALAPCAQGRVVAHGDFTLGNILVDQRGCIDVGRLGLADPYQDIAIAWRDLGGFGEDAQTRFLTALDIAQVDERRMQLHLSLDELS